MSVAVSTPTMSAKSTPAGIRLSGIAPVEITPISIYMSKRCTMVDKTATPISAISISAVGISATVVIALKTPPVEATAVEIPRIPSFKERPVVGIVAVIPVVPVPGWVVIVRIPRKFVLIDYTVAGGIAVRIGIDLLVRRIGFLVDSRRRLVNHRRWRYINTRPAKRKPEMCVHIYLRIAPGGD